LAAPSQSLPSSHHHHAYAQGKGLAHGGESYVFDIVLVSPGKYFSVVLLAVNGIDFYQFSPDHFRLDRSYRSTTCKDAGQDYYYGNSFHNHWFCMM
jgi:hypothetical protein